ncbi:hypothetical protein GOP47_0003343 [Adiantum capillus-veneris]|uniref:SHSP domain-containing protein n=1 Tax=Adiantum capillus-veneris TaxID=13818 RepID=A0A9D4VCM6_ADICA|nr:hypothetical protein GOP47_0002616 [Adiantum capillus-veneris]KAI5083600.1 hypothetical protein GOP47_0003343 [Adiantum capillus-veneris]
MDRYLWFASADAHVPVDWFETSSAHIFKLDVPGISKKDVQVHVQEDGTLEISGEFKNVEEKGHVTWYAAERSLGRFARQFQLPDNVKLDDVKAVIEAGVLTVTIPKRHHVKSAARNVPVISKL